MYFNYFGLKEASFSITPDPQYLFLSEQHREALAHLLYGAGESGGFVLLTGEVGTGKTTVCRAFLEQVPDGVDVALILNPAMTVTELLGAICDEFCVQVSETDRTVKRLVDRLNDYLLKAHAEGRRSVLMIDEAQDLKPKVLEQIRLLTNLETAKHKLLQIFLVGQPELRVLLQHEGLRQLNQRITARHHLRPFEPADTAEYVRHRLAVAGVERQLFTRAALRRVHRISGGIPRVINILCDRSLLGACVTRNPLVTKSIVDKAAHEVTDPLPVRGRPLTTGRVSLVAASLALALAIGWIIRSRMPELPFANVVTSFVPDFLAPWLPARQTDSSGQANRNKEVKTPRISDVESRKTPEATEDQLPSVALARVEKHEPTTDLAFGDVTMSRSEAMRLLLRRWGVELGELGPGDPCERVSDYGLRCEVGRGGWSRMRFFNRPALIKLSAVDSPEAYTTIGALNGDVATLDLVEGSRPAKIASLDKYWNGEYLVLWQPPPVGGDMIGPGSAGESVRWLRKLLSQVPYLGLDTTDSGKFDQALEEALRRFQEREGLKSDGIAGPKTLIRLHNVVAMPEIPRLTRVP